MLELIDQLPRTSRLWAARVNDPEEARIIAAQLEAQGEKDYSPSLVEFDLKADQNAQIIDLLQILIRNMGGGKGDIKPFPRPVTEVHREQERREREWTVDLLGKLGFDESYI